MEDLVKERMQKMDELRTRGINPYGQRFERTAPIKHYIEHYQEGLEASVAGRLMSYRGHGKAIFCDLHDWTGKIQIYIKEDKIGEERFNIFKYVDIGDILGIKGTLFKTHTGEITILVLDFIFLSKALRPLPEKWHGLKDVELRYRQRYLDLLVNKDVKDIFIKRSRIITAIRNFLDGHGFIEVETPMMQDLPGGAIARPFITHHTALDIDLYLRIAPELYLKRLLVGGFEKVYEINKNFRNEGISRVHNPEFTMLEVYAAYEDYLYMMELTEELITEVAKQIGVDIPRPWRRLSIYEAIKIYTGVDLINEPKTRYAEIAKGLGVEIKNGAKPSDIVDEIFKAGVEKKLIQPTFITDYPIELCPLSKAKPQDPGSAERFELFINGMEIANAYSELNDPIEQRRRFQEQLAEDPTGIRRLDEDFLRALEYGMPPAGGLGIGIDRLVMVLCGVDNVREVILFPQLRPVSG